MRCMLSFPIFATIIMAFGTACLAEAPSGVQSCALREAKMMALLETRDAEHAPQTLMSRAGTEMHQARLACYAGRNDDSHAVYDRIDLLLGASPTAMEVRR
jgi:hypothetical protein